MVMMFGKTMVNKMGERNLLWGSHGDLNFNQYQTNMGIFPPEYHIKTGIFPSYIR